ncbi:hypothetical protein AB0395_21625 [Streptosporangium sp. NPDC051023]|uniref:hypothetical protein n=1 Tax=Streptosporangium sp. NPDC051023 TaxID=3155410 RepID=UPI00344F60B8
MSRVAEAAQRRVTGRSSQAARLFADLKAAPPDARRRFLAALTGEDLRQVLAVAAREGGTPYSLWDDDPVGFVHDVLGEATWSKPREILAAIPSSKRVAVPSCFSSGKTWSLGRATLWWSFVHPPGQAKAVTLAPTWRQVVRLVWSEIRHAHTRAGLPGTVDAAQLKIPDGAGREVVASYGLSAAPWNEAAVQGIHSPRLLLVVDEAGGISTTIGRNLRGMLSSQGSHMVAMGNPPTDEESSWFESLCDQDGVLVIPISAYDTPALSGEAAPRCRSCLGSDHAVTKHLVEPSWVSDTIAEHGEDSNYVQSKVHARFPRGGPNRVLPSAWVDEAAASDEPDSPEHMALCDLELPDESASWKVKRNDWIRLGVDVASDGGDEMVISRCVGDLLTIQHVSAGAANLNQVDVAGAVLKEIRRAELLRERLGSREPIRVKVDAIGVGWGVVGTLTRWGDEGVHDAVIVGVNVAEDTEREPDADTLLPARKRDELWLSMRALLRPTPAGHALRLRVDSKTLAQLRSPTMTTNSRGQTVVESKDKMRRRGLSSPDRAESALLCVYEPAPRRRRKKRARLVV